MPRQCSDEEWDRDALLASRKLVSLEFAAEHLEVATHAIEQAGLRTRGALLVWVFGVRGKVMRKDRDLYVDLGPRPGPDLPRAWQGHSPEELLGVGSAPGDSGSRGQGGSPRAARRGRSSGVGVDRALGIR
jgi:hypothetical protein